MWGSYCNIPRAIFYLLQGGYKILWLRVGGFWFGAKGFGRRVQCLIKASGVEFRGVRFWVSEFSCNMRGST